MCRWRCPRRRLGVPRNTSSRTCCCPVGRPAAPHGACSPITPSTVTGSWPDCGCFPTEAERSPFAAGSCGLPAPADRSLAPRPPAVVLMCCAHVVARQPHVPDQLRNRPFLGSAAIAAGLLSARQLRSAAWVRLVRNVYVHHDVEQTGLVRAQALSLVLRPSAVVAGITAAWLHRVWNPRPGQVVPLEYARERVDHGKGLTGAHMRRRVLCVDDGPWSDVIEIGGIPFFHRCGPASTSCANARSSKPSSSRTLMPAPDSSNFSGSAHTSMPTYLGQGSGRPDLLSTCRRREADRRGKPDSASSSSWPASQLHW